MLGVCIGIGDGWGTVAENTARAMQKMTGVECVAIKEPMHPAVHPSWLKCHIIDHYPDHDSFLLFDADLLCLRPWDPQGWFESMGRPFMAVPDARTQNVLRECESLGIAFPDTYINGGMTIFGAEHKPIWDETWSRHPKCGRWLEQGSLNLSLLNQNPQVCRLPRRFNWVTFRGNVAAGELEREGIVNLHACSSDSPSALLTLQKRFGII